MSESAAAVTPLLVSKRGIANLLGFSTRWVDQAVKRGMPCLAIGSRRLKFEPDEVLAWMRDTYRMRKRAPAVPVRPSQAPEVGQDCTALSRVS